MAQPWSKNSRAAKDTKAVQIDEKWRIENNSWQIIAIDWGTTTLISYRKCDYRSSSDSLRILRPNHLGLSGEAMSGPTTRRAENCPTHPYDAPHYSPAVACPDAAPRFSWQSPLAGKDAETVSNPG
ncbi:MAG: hypothetical protein F9K25_17645 [Candidatus Contendobacter sp.]|nr:MAG: hypothetical protein F9K25_17645 [Candidatus Contendobacter sp.]